MLVSNAGIHKMLVCFVALRPKSTAMVMAGRSVHLTTLFFLASLNKRLNTSLMHILLHVTENNPAWMNQQKGG